MKTYEVTAARSGQWWSIEASVPRASVWTQARRMDQIEATVREAIALSLDVTPDSFEINVHIELPEDLREDVEIASVVANIAEIAQDAAAVARRVVALKLQEQGLTVRDIGRVLNLSSQRISQLVSSDAAKTDDFDSRMARVRKQLAEIEAQSERLLSSSRKDVTSGRSNRTLAKTG
jgi:predicted transcriptional regulator